MVFLFYHRRPSFFIVYFYWSGSKVLKRQEKDTKGFYHRKYKEVIA